MQMHFITVRFIHMMIPRRFLTAIALLTASAISADANVILPGIFGDHMVLQRNAEVTIWGFAKPFEEVSLHPQWSDEVPSMLTRADGRWELQVHTPDSGGPYTLIVKGWNEIKIEDVLIGEVWLGSGQSNMELTGTGEQFWAKGLRESGKPGTFDPDRVDAVLKAASDSAADYPQLRFFNVGQVQGSAEQNDLYGHWEVCTPESMMNTSLVGFYFSRELSDKLDGVPVGLIHSSWGGTPAETWIPASEVSGDRILAAAAAVRPEVTWGPTKPGLLYNSMISPLVPFRIAGVIWYQGEGNVGFSNGSLVYDRSLSTLARSWRSEWGYDFPFLYVQIAPYRYNSDNPAAYGGTIIRDAQRKALGLIPNSGMAVIDDVGNIEDIHPKYKEQVGHRLVLWALDKAYSVSDELPSGPLYKGMEVEGKAIRISFDYASGGLKSADGKDLSDFQIAGKDKVFHPATAVIDGETLLVSSPEVSKPVAVRFAWCDIATPNFVGSSGLPASCFRTDDWKLSE